MSTGIAVTVCVYNDEESTFVERIESGEKELGDQYSIELSHSSSFSIPRISIPRVP
jgi:hypothetical protein